MYTTCIVIIHFNSHVTLVRCAAKVKFKSYYVYSYMIYYLIVTHMSLQEYLLLSVMKVKVATVVWFKLAVGNIHEKKFHAKKFSS